VKIRLFSCNMYLNGTIQSYSISEQIALSWPDTMAWCSGCNALQRLTGCIKGNAVAAGLGHTHLHACFCADAATAMMLRQPVVP